MKVRDVVVLMKIKSDMKLEDIKGWFKGIEIERGADNGYEWLAVRKVAAANVSSKPVRHRGGRHRVPGHGR